MHKAEASQAAATRKGLPKDDTEIPPSRRRRVLKEA